MTELSTIPLRQVNSVAILVKSLGSCFIACPFLTRKRKDGTWFYQMGIEWIIISSCYSMQKYYKCNSQCALVINPYWDLAIISPEKIYTPVHVSKTIGRHHWNIIHIIQYVCFLHHFLKWKEVLKCAAVMQCEI